METTFFFAVGGAELGFGGWIKCGCLFHGVCFVCCFCCCDYWRKYTTMEREESG
jgi:hypothetical protein